MEAWLRKFLFFLLKNEYAFCARSSVEVVRGRMGRQEKVAIVGSGTTPPPIRASNGNLMETPEQECSTNSIFNKDL